MSGISLAIGAFVFACTGVASLFVASSEPKHILASIAVIDLTSNGKPLANQSIIRTIRWDDQSWEQTSTTNASGHVVIQPYAVRRVKWSWGSEKSIKQEVRIAGTEGDDGLILTTIKRDLESGSEFDSSGFEMRCELADPLAPEEFGTQIIISRCQFAPHKQG